MHTLLRPSNRFLPVLIVTFIWGAILSGCSLNSAIPLPTDNAQPSAEVFSREPGPDLSAEEVVRIQVEALQQNNEADQGIEATFRFASPSNKQATGPLARFKRMLKERAYRPMLNHKLAEYAPMEISESTASQRVTIIQRNGQATVYLFMLSKQEGPPCPGCWMTDSVTVLPTRNQRLQDI
jgi:hypothetical protein